MKESEQKHFTSRSLKTDRKQRSQKDLSEDRLGDSERRTYEQRPSNRSSEEKEGESRNMEISL